MPEFYTIIARRIFFPIFFGGPPPPPISYTYVYRTTFSRQLAFLTACISDITPPYGTTTARAHRTSVLRCAELRKVFWKVGWGGCGRGLKVTLRLSGVCYLIVGPIYTAWKTRLWAAGCVSTYGFCPPFLQLVATLPHHALVTWSLIDASVSIAAAARRILRQLPSNNDVKWQRDGS